MPLAEVGDLVGEHGGELILALGVEQQAGVNADHATRDRESVDDRVVHDHYFNAAILQLAMGDQAIDQVFEVVLQQGVIECGRLGAEYAQPGPAQLVLLLGGKQAGAAFAKIWQLEFLGGRRAGVEEHHRQQKLKQGSDHSVDGALGWILTTVWERGSSRNTRESSITGAALAILVAPSESRE